LNVVENGADNDSDEEYRWTNHQRFIRLNHVDPCAGAWPQTFTANTKLAVVGSAACFVYIFFLTPFLVIFSK
jgi:hypothetical protein